MENPIELIEEILSNDLGKRGIANLIIKGDLEKAAHSLLDAKTVLIVTGFYVKNANNGETDGPIGALSIGSALASLGKKVVFVTDPYTYDIMDKAILTFMGPWDHIQFPMENEETFSEYIMDTYCPTHIIAIERVGQAKDHQYYNMRGENISPYVAKTDILFHRAQERGIITIGIGDGGNEIGMGKVFDRIKDCVHNGEKIGCITPTDYVIVSGVSNWAGHGLNGCLSILSKKNLLHNGEKERELLQTLIDSGAVDGCTLKKELSVDAFPLEVHQEILQKIHEIIQPRIA